MSMAMDKSHTLKSKDPMTHLSICKTDYYVTPNDVIKSQEKNGPSNFSRTKPQLHSGHKRLVPRCSLNGPEQKTQQLQHLNVWSTLIFRKRLQMLNCAWLGFLFHAKNNRRTHFYSALERCKSDARSHVFHSHFKKTMTKRWRCWSALTKSIQTTTIVFSTPSTSSPTMVF